MNPLSICREERHHWLLYTAGPITSNCDGAMSEHVERAKGIAVRLRRLGWSVICPHLNSIEIVGFTLDDYLWEDFAILGRVDALVLLPGWRNSAGSLREVEFASKKQPVPLPVWDWSILLGGE
jgi:hypothetical protein